MPCGKVMMIHLTIGLIKKMLLHKNELISMTYFKPYSHN